MMELIRFSGFWMAWINPINFLRLLHRGYVQVHDDRFLATTDYHAHERFVRLGVDLLMGDERGHIDKIARTRVREKL